ncbi:hypothetical protein WMY93_016515 [Mugilogobius chulae]|uniref:PG1 pseudoGTPase domain-containing protein n=1 Tax=Mugilogobius chulae TaxID=88201 RepID=A0AAW0NLU1_9GOBI
MSTLLFSHTWVSTFKPHGCFCVFNSIESLNSIGDCIGRIRAEIAGSRRDRFVQPLPFILILANQRDNICKNIPILRHQGQQLANKLQCTFVDIPSGAFPRKFTEFQIKQGLRAVLENMKHSFDFLAPLPSIKDMSETDLRIVMCAMCWDPFSVDLILSPFLDSHCCSAGPTGQSNSLIIDKILGETRRRIQYHRQTEVFTPFFNESFPAYNTYYPDSDDDNEAPPPYSPIGDDVQLLPTPSERAKYRIDLEGNEYPIHSTPVGEHERNHKVPPPVRPKPVLTKPNVRKLDPNLLKTIEAGMRSNRRMPRPPLVHAEDVEASDNYADPVDTLRSRGYINDDIYAVPEDSHSRLIKIRNSFGGLHHSGLEEENGYERKANSTGRRPSKYKHRSKILFSKTKAYQRRFHSDSDGEESGPATQKKKREERTGEAKKIRCCLRPIRGNRESITRR